MFDNRASFQYIQYSWKRWFIFPIPETDLGRKFLYLRYNAELTEEGLKKLGLGDIEPKEVSKLDSTDGMPDLQRIGKALAKQINLDDFGSFV